MLWVQFDYVSRSYFMTLVNLICTSFIEWKDLKSREKRQIDCFLILSISICWVTLSSLHWMLSDLKWYWSWEEQIEGDLWPSHHSDQEHMWVVERPPSRVPKRRGSPLGSGSGENWARHYLSDTPAAQVWLKIWRLWGVSWVYAFFSYSRVFPLQVTSCLWVINTWTSITKNEWGE